MYIAHYVLTSRGPPCPDKATCNLSMTDRRRELRALTYVLLNVRVFIVLLCVAIKFKANAIVDRDAVILILDTSCTC
jgi:hypothetical protein